MPDTNSVPHGILKSSKTGGSRAIAKKSIQWDEGSLIQTDLERKLYASQKIDEPKTPFIRSIPLSDYHSGSSSGPEDALFDLETPALEPDSLPQEIGSRTTDIHTSFCDSDAGEMQTDGEHNTMQPESSDSDASFLQRRSSHYHNMKHSIDLGKSLLQSGNDSPP